MSSTRSFDLVMKAVVHTADEQTALAVQELLSNDVGGLSCSPLRESQSLNDCFEFMATAVVSESVKDAVLAKWDNDWDEDEERNGTEIYWAYAFNTKMAYPDLYYLELEFRPIHSRSI